MHEQPEKEETTLESLREEIKKSREIVERRFSGTKNPWAACLNDTLGPVHTYLYLLAREKKITDMRLYAQIELTLNKLSEDVKKMDEEDGKNINHLEGEEREEKRLQSEPSKDVKEDLFSRLDAIGEMIEKSIIDK